MAHHDRPTAVFCVNDLIAFGLMDHARGQLGLAVPRDLAVIGFDDVPQARWRPYRLTTFRQDPEDLAVRVVDLLDRRAADPDQPPIRDDFAAPLLIRDSFVPASPPHGNEWR
jgi:DNA-binding LacI/PurR family transcriptional regulator